MNAIRLFAISFLGLFLELACIRWIPGTVRLMGFYTNVVLISAFLGLGLGLLLARDKRDWFYLFAPLSALLIGLCHFSPLLFNSRPFALGSILALAATAIWALRRAFPGRRRTVWLLAALAIVGGAAALAKVVRESGGFHALIGEGYAMWGGFGVSAAWVFAVPIVFLITTGLFLCVGQILGRELTAFSPLAGYSLNILGSLIGVVTFAVLSYIGTSPTLWFGIAFAGIMVYLTRRPAYLVGSALLLAGCILLLTRPQADGVALWSPYYKIQVSDLPAGRGPFSVLVNHSFHQAARDFSTTVVDTKETVNVRRRYDLPYQVSQPRSVLLLGAGTGNDVAAAVRAGVPDIDVVEIDPIIFQLGRDHHPESPYSQPGVHPYITDARAFLRNTRKRYDLIVFGTLDSHTLFSGMGNIRLDSYVYTMESIREARDHLTDRGVLSLTFSVGRPWIGSKIEQMIRANFAHAPVVFGGDHQVFLVSQDPTFAARAAQVFDASGLPEVADVTMPTDDWPHLYVRQKSLSNEYLSILFVLAAFSIFLTRALVWRTAGFDVVFFLLGGGFLLLETKSVTSLALLFGSTWTVNCVVFSAILTTALLSNLVVHQFRPTRLEPWLTGLLLALVVNLAVRPERLLVESVAWRIALASAFVALPIFFSGVVFATLFARVTEPAAALGSNLIGAVIGGMLEYSSLLLGSRAMYVLAFAIYALAWYWLRARGGRVSLAPSS